MQLLRTRNVLIATTKPLRRRHFLLLLVFARGRLGGSPARRAAAQGGAQGGSSQLLTELLGIAGILALLIGPLWGSSQRSAKDDRRSFPEKRMKTSDRPVDRQSAGEGEPDRSFSLTTTAADGQMCGSRARAGARWAGDERACAKIRFPDTISGHL